MITQKIINKTFEDLNREEIILNFLRDDSKKTQDYSSIRQMLISKNMSKRADHHLKKLIKVGLLEKEERGEYRLSPTAIQPLRNKYDRVNPICLIGGLGIPTLYTDILSALGEISIIPKKYVLVTSPDYNEEFRRYDKGKYEKLNVEIFEFDYQSVLRENYEKLYSELKKAIDKQIYDYEVICEITGGTKPVSVALLNISTEYGLRRCYFSGRKIIWI